MIYKADWVDCGGNPWPSENEGRWPKERFDTYAVTDEHGAVICVTGRHQPDWVRAQEIAVLLTLASSADET